MSINEQPFTFWSSIKNKKKDNIRILEFRKLILSFLCQTSLKFPDKQEYLKFIINLQ